jgi:hypothetical protein
VSRAHESRRIISAMRRDSARFYSGIAELRKAFATLGGTALEGTALTCQDTLSILGRSSPSPVCTQQAGVNTGTACELTEQTTIRPSHGEIPAHVLHLRCSCDISAPCTRRK